MNTRLFIAIDLPDDVKRQLGRLTRLAPEGVRPVREEQIHLTLHFLGDVERATMDAAIAGLRGVAAPAFSIDIGGVGRFPPRGRPSVVWAGVAPNAALLLLHEAIGNVLVTCGVAVEQRGFTPHVTLARLTERAPRKWLEQLLLEQSDLAIHAIQVAAFAVFSSTRTDSGSVHTVEAVYPLR